MEGLKCQYMSTNASHADRFKRCFLEIMRQFLLNVLIVATQILPDCSQQFLYPQEHSLTRVELAAEEMSDAKRLLAPLKRNVRGIETFNE